MSLTFRWIEVEAKSEMSTFNCKKFQFLTFYTDRHNYAYTWKTLDIGTRLFDNVAFVSIHVTERFSEDFLEVRGLRGRGSQIWCKCKLEE